MTILTADLCSSYDISVIGRLAQLARASALHAEGRGFEPLSAHHQK